jgi:FG-GAP repeat protein
LLASLLEIRAARAQAPTERWRALGEIETAVPPTDGFGYSVAVAGSHALVGQSLGGSTSVTIAYYATFNGKSWSAEPVTALPDVNWVAWYAAVALSESTALVATQPSLGMSESADRSVWDVLTFGVDSDALTFTGVFDHSDAPGELFAQAISLDGASAAVGSTCDGVPCDWMSRYAGSASLYRLGADGAWVHDQEIVPDGLTPADRFGAAVQLDGDTLVVAAANTMAGGSVYVFERHADGFEQVQTLTGESTSPPAGFGSTLSLRGDRLVIGAPLAAEGSAYVYERGSDGFKLARRLQAIDLGGGARFGACVAQNDDTLAVGAPGANRQLGALVLYALADLREQSRPRPEQALEQRGGYGAVIALSSEHLLVSAPGADRLFTGKGKVYAFRRDATAGNDCTQASSCATQSCALGACGEENVGRFGADWDAGPIDRALAAKELAQHASGGCALGRVAGVPIHATAAVVLVAVLAHRRRRSRS